MKTSEKIKVWARELRSIAQTGLTYGNDVFDKERYEQMNELSNTMLAHISGMSDRQINSLLPIEQGYATPKIAVRGLVIQDNKVLMVKEIADGLWTLPGGWCDIGLTPSENIEKEIKEETGLHTQATQLLTIFDQTKHRESETMQHIYTIYFLCEIISGELTCSIETEAVEFFPANELPPLSIERMTEEQFKTAYLISEEKNQTAYFD